MYGIAIELVEWLYSYLNLDASTGEYPEEEGCYQEEEEENFDHYQGKLIFLQSAKPFGARHHESYLFLHKPIPSLYFTSFTCCFPRVTFIVNFGQSKEVY